MIRKHLRKYVLAHFGFCILAGIALLVGAGSVASADVPMDQIGANPAFFNGQGAEASQQFEASFSTFNIALVDDFTVSGSALTIVQVRAAMLGFNGFTSPNTITGYRVEIYSSLTAANTSLTGDVASSTSLPADATVTSPYSSDPLSFLVSLPTNIQLPGVGTYYLSVMAINDLQPNGQVGVYITSPGPTGSTPGGLNAVQENPAGGFSLPGNAHATNSDAAYALTTAVPEPTGIALGAFALGLPTFQRRRRRVG